MSVQQPISPGEQVEFRIGPEVLTGTVLESDWAPRYNQADAMLSVDVDGVTWRVRETEVYRIPR